jgi:hypothetical protein
VVSSARTDEVLKVIVANPTMIKAYKAGVPGNGQPFPDGSEIVKLQWKPKKSTEAPFVVDVPDVFTQAFVMEKDSKRFPKTGVQLRSRIGQVHGRSQPLRLRTFVPCGREGEGLHLPPVPEALNRACPRHQVPSRALPANKPTEKEVGFFSAAPVVPPINVLEMSKSEPSAERLGKMQQHFLPDSGAVPL